MGRRAGAAHSRDDQALFGIVQGGLDPNLRASSAATLADVGFDGYGIGGLSVGETRDEMVDALGACIDLLPSDRPRYLMGVGDPGSIVEAVALGVDQFDCVLQTRLGRHGTALTSTGKLHLKNARHTADPARSTRVRLPGLRPAQPRLPAPPVPGAEPTASRLVSSTTWRGRPVEEMGPDRGSAIVRRKIHATGRDAGVLVRVRLVAGASLGAATYSRFPAASVVSRTSLTDWYTMLALLPILAPRQRRPAPASSRSCRSSSRRPRCTSCSSAPSGAAPRAAVPRAQLEEGDEIITNGGIYGFITAIDGDVLWLEVDDDAQIRITPGGHPGQGRHHSDQARGRRSLTKPAATSEDNANDATHHRRRRRLRRTTATMIRRRLWARSSASSVVAVIGCSP